MPKKDALYLTIEKQFGRDVSADIDLIKRTIDELAANTTVMRVTVSDLTTNGPDEPSFVTLRIDPPSEEAITRYYHDKAMEGRNGADHLH